MQKLQLIRELRERTSVSLSLCKRSLVQTDYDIEEAIVALQKMGEASKVKRSGKSAKEGRVVTKVHTYNHHNNKIAVMVEVNCETEASARTDQFIEFCENLTLQVASAAPDYLSVNDIPEAVMAKQREIFSAQVPKGVPEGKVDHVINGKLKKWFGEVCLVDQKSVMVNKKTVEQLRSDLVQQIEENVVIKRFVRWELGEA